MENNIVSFSKEWSEDEKMTILFALRRVNELEGETTTAQKLYQEEQEAGLFGKFKRHFS